MRKRFNSSQGVAAMLKAPIECTVDTRLKVVVHRFPNAAKRCACGKIDHSAVTRPLLETLKLQGV